MEYAPSTCSTGGFSHQERLGLDGGSSTGQVLRQPVDGWGGGHGWRARLAGGARAAAAAAAQRGPPGVRFLRAGGETCRIIAPHAGWGWR